jgi:hypothetical protein
MATKILSAVELQLAQMNLQEADAEALKHRGEAERLEQQAAERREREAAALGKSAEIREQHSKLLSDRDSLADAIFQTNWYLDNARNNPENGFSECERNLAHFSGLPNSQGHVADWTETALRQQFILDLFPKFLEVRKAELEKVNADLAAFERQHNIVKP